MTFVTDGKKGIVRYRVTKEICHSQFEQTQQPYKIVVTTDTPCEEEGCKNNVQNETEYGDEHYSRGDALFCKIASAHYYQSHNLHTPSGKIQLNIK